MIETKKIKTRKIKNCFEFEKKRMSNNFCNATNYFRWKKDLVSKYLDPVDLESSHPFSSAHVLRLVHSLWPLVPCLVPLPHLWRLPLNRNRKENTITFQNGGLVYILCAAATKIKKPCLLYPVDCDRGFEEQLPSPSICTERIPRSLSCCWLFWANRRRRSAASRGMLKVTRTLFHGSTCCGWSLSGPT